MERPDWIDPAEYPFEDRWADVGGAHVHYVDEGSGPPLLFLHGNPTWSFTWRVPIRALRDRFRCVALDYPGFGLSSARDGYGFTPAEHARVVEQFVQELDLRGITLVVQDWGGPIGFRAAECAPDRYARFVVGNTWAWPKSDLPTRMFSAFLGGPIGGYLILKRNAFVERIVPSATKRSGPSEAAMAAYRGPFPTAESRTPMHVLPRAIIGSLDWLAEIERGLSALRDHPALILWPTRDQAFGERERKRWEQVFEDHRTVLLEGAGHYIGEDAGDEIAAAIRDWHPGAAG